MEEGAGKRFRAWMKVKVGNKRRRQRGIASEEAKNKYWDKENKRANAMCRESGSKRLQNKEHTIEKTLIKGD